VSMFCTTGTEAYMDCHTVQKELLSSKLFSTLATVIKRFYTCNMIKITNGEACPSSFIRITVQSRQSAKPFLPSSELGLSHPLTRRRV
jgi:hypothetical protein